MISYLAHLGIVRVLSLPVVLTLIIYLLWIMAAPPKDGDDEA